MTLYFISYLSILTFITSIDRLERFIRFWILINVICAVIGISNGGKIPHSGFMGDENDFALAMNMAIPFTYFMMLGSTSLRRRLLYLACTLLFVVANVSSFSRGGFVGLIPVILFCWYKSPRKILSSVTIGLVLIATLLTASGRYWDEIRSIREQNINEGTGAIRWYYWKNAWKMFLDNPIIGVGQGNFPWVLTRYEPPEGFHGRKHGGRASHSLYFTLLPELGFVGVLLFGTMLSKAYHHYREIVSVEWSDDPVRQRAPPYVWIANGTFGALLGYLVSGAFLSVLYYPHIWFLLALLLLLKTIHRRHVSSLEEVSSNNEIDMLIRRPV